MPANPLTIIFILLSTLLYNTNCGILRSNDQDVQETLVHQFNNYVDQTMDMINKRQTTPLSLPNHFTKGKWGYLVLDVDYSLKLYDGSVTGMRRLTRRGDAFINYDKTSGNLTISACLVSQQIKATYAVKLNFYGRTHWGKVNSDVPGLNINVTFSVNAANLRVHLDHISATTTQAPNVKFYGNDTVLNYFAPLITELSTVSDLTIPTIVQSSIQTTIDVLNSPSFGYY